MCQKKVYNQCILPVVCYGAETLRLIKKTIYKINVAQWAMKGAVRPMFFRDSVPYMEMRK